MLDSFDQLLLNKSESERIEDARLDWSRVGLSFFDKHRHAPACPCGVKDARFLFRIQNMKSGEILQICGDCADRIGTGFSPNAILDGAVDLVRDVRSFASVGLLYFGIAQGWVTREEADKYMKFSQTPYRRLPILPQLHIVEINLRFLKRFVIPLTLEPQSDGRLNSH